MGSQKLLVSLSLKPWDSLQQYCHEPNILLRYLKELSMGMFLRDVSAELVQDGPHRIRLR